MQLWQILYMAFALVLAIGCIAIILHRWHVIEKAEEQEWYRQLKERAEAIR